jgi:phosphodiesterase/alkaline phosphatase D-like protein
MPSRRAFLSALAALGFTRALPAYSQSRPRFSSEPFKLGVASGYPSHEGLTLWTRLAPEPTQADGGLDRHRSSPVVSHDDRFAQIAATGTQTPGGAHSVHVDARPRA